MGDFPLSFEDWEKKAKEKLNPERFAYVAAGAGDGDVMDENKRALRRWRLLPRVLGNNSTPSITAEVLGVETAAPVMLAPVRGLDYVHPEGQNSCARAASKCGVPLVLSNLASSTLEEVAAILGKTPRFLQLYPCTDAELVQSFVSRAEKAGYSGLFLTVDTSGHPIQYRGPESSEYMDYGNEVYLSDPVFVSRLKQPVTKDRKAALELIRKVREGIFTWDDIDRIQRSTRLPVILKGILSPDDAKEAVSHGVSGLVVSNHGGRTLSGEVASIDMLPEIIEATETKLSVLYDGGVRSGTDVLKALALGAKTVLIGRAYVYALAYGGEQGVQSMLTTIMREIKSGLATCGCSSVKDINGSLIRRFS
ncbi:MAG TPA: alpha-hydroxy-acid oxidizing protein [Nitrososphaerales archaeon]|nr:alpha-hydroxy-acid oxidizing protein [Nitrososphaerales archaeon]